MRIVAALPFVAATLIGSASLPERGDAESGQNRLFLDANNRTPLGEVLSFDSEAGVANFFGARSLEASLAAQFFAGARGASAHMLFARFPVGGARAPLWVKYRRAHA